MTWWAWMILGAVLLGAELFRRRRTVLILYFSAYQRPSLVWEDSSALSRLNGFSGSHSPSCRCSFFLPSDARCTKKFMAAARNILIHYPATPSQLAKTWIGWC